MSDAPSRGAMKSVISAFLDDAKPDNIAIFLVREVLTDSGAYIQAGAVQASTHAGWRVDPGTWLKNSQQYDDVGDHSLLTDEEAQTYLDDKGLTLEDGRRMLIDYVTEVGGSPPVILPADPGFKARRDAARARLDLPPKP